MKNTKLILGLFLLIGMGLSAQKDKKVDDLVFLYVDGKYDKLVYKAEALMQHDDYRRHPLPYIYASMGYYEMSKLPGKYSVGERDSEFPKPLKLAQKHLYKFHKKDEKAPKYYDGQSWGGDFKEYYLNIADTSNKLAQYFFHNDDYRKSASVYKYAAKAVPDDPVLTLWLGITHLKSRNTYEGKLALEEAMKVIDENFVPSKSTQNVLAHGMLLAEELLRANEMYEYADKAKKLIEVFKKYDPDQLDEKKLEERKEEAKKDDTIMRKFYSDEEDEENKNKKGEVIIKDGYGSGGNGNGGNSGSDKSADEKLDALEKERKRWWEIINHHVN